MNRSTSPTPPSRPKPRGRRAISASAALCAIFAISACGSTLRTSDPGIASASSAAALQAGPGDDAASRSSATAAGSLPAASETKAPAVSASYIAASASATTASVYIQGDSLTVPITGLLAKLMPRDLLTISAKIGRPLSVGLAQLTARSKLRALDQIIVMEMGSNDDPALTSLFGRRIDQTMALVGPDRCAVWVNLYQRATKKVGKTRVTYNVYDALNTVISEAPLLRSCDLPVLSRPIGDRQPNGRPMMLKIDAMLEFEGAAPCDEVLRKQPQVLQRLDGLFGGLRIGDLQGSRGSYQLRADMLQLVNEVLAPIRVKDVLFKEMLVH